MILHLSYRNLIWYLLGSEVSFILVLFRTLQPEYLQEQFVQNIASFHELFGVQCNCPHAVYMTNRCAGPYKIFNALFFFVLILSNCCDWILFSASFAMQIEA